jgi:hypothetical protein
MVAHVNRSLGISDTTKTWLGIGVVLLVLLAFSVPAWRLAVTPMDEGSLLVYPTLVLHGEEPNRDFETFYGPGNLWVLAGSYGLAGPSVAVERAMGWIYRAAIVITAFLLARRKSVWVGLACGVLAAGLLVLLGLLAYAWLGGLALALCALYLATGRRYTFVAGLLAGLAVLFRTDLLLPVVILAVFAVPWRRYAAGVAVGVAPFLIHIARVGVGTAFRTEVLDPIGVQLDRHLPLGWAGWFPWIVLVSIGVGIVVGAAEWRSAGDTRLLAIALFEVGLLPQAFQRSDTTHLLMVGCVTMAMVPLFLASIPRMPATSGYVLLAGASVIAAGAVANGSAYAARMGPGFPVSHDGRTVYAQSAKEAGQIAELADAVDRDSRSGDRIIVGPTDMTRTPYNDTFLYFLFPDLIPGTYHLEMNPGSANGPNSHLAGDLERANLVITTNRYADWYEPNGSLDPGPTTPQTVLGDRFCGDRSIGQWNLLVTCDHGMLGPAP